MREMNKSMKILKTGVLMIVVLIIFLLDISALHGGRSAGVKTGDCTYHDCQGFSKNESIAMDFIQELMEINVDEKKDSISSGY